LLGSLATPNSLAVSAINTTSNQLTVTAHGLATADDVLVHMSTGGTMPALASGTLSNSTRYYVKVVDANTLTLHVDAAAATAGTGALDFTDSGTGTLYVDRDYPLVIHTFSGVKLTLHNAAITKMPGINAQATDTLLGDVEFEAFLRNGANWSDANSRWTIAAVALSDTSFNPTQILTQGYSGAWGAAPWDSWQTKAGFSVNFETAWEDVTSDALGVVTKRLKSLKVTAKAQPLGFTEQQILEKLLIQNTGAVRGRSLSGADLNIAGTGVYIRLYGAALKTGPQNFSSGNERVGELEWVSTRTFSSGTPNPLFYVGTAAPGS